jgi:hypothetical protein
MLTWAGPTLWRWELDSPCHAVQDVSLWFLLLWLLSLHENRAFAALRGSSLAFTWSTPGFGWSAGCPELESAVDRSCPGLRCRIDSFLLLFEAFPLVLVGYAFFQRKQFDSARWLVAILAFLDENDARLQQHGETRPPVHRLVYRGQDRLAAFFLDGNGISSPRSPEHSCWPLLFTRFITAFARISAARMRWNGRRLELLHESNRMRHHAEHDGLTGLWNHRMIVERLGEEMIRSLRDGTPLSVILADVDHFKKVNDTFGHLAGDLVLKEIGTSFAHSASL